MDDNEKENYTVLLANYDLSYPVGCCVHLSNLSSIQIRGHIESRAIGSLCFPSDLIFPALTIS